MPLKTKIAKILVIDDDIHNLKLMLHHLQRLDYDVLAAPSAAGGKRMAQLERPDLILIDLAMPFTDGVTAIHELKDDESLRSIPIIVVTGFNSFDFLERAKAAGCDDYEIKPVNYIELASKIERLRLSA